MSDVITYNPLFLPADYRTNRNGHWVVQTRMAPVQTTDATPLTVWSIPVPSDGSSVRIWVQGHAVQSDGTQIFEFENRNAYRRAAGATTRVAPAGGQGTTAANTFAVTRPALSWGDGSSNTAVLQLVGKAATTINWYLVVLVTANFQV